MQKQRDAKMPSNRARISKTASEHGKWSLYAKICLTNEWRGTIPKIGVVMEIKITCKGADLLPLDAIEEFQGGLKKRTKRDIDLIIKSIEKYGFSFPFFVWNGSGHNYCLDGHGRIQALAEMRRRGVSLPLFPVDYIEAADEAEAKQKLLRINSQYGKMTVDSVMEFTEGLMVDWDELELIGNIKIKEEENDSVYTKIIKAPIYKITGEKPTLIELCDTSKAEKIIQEVKRAQISDDEKIFLINAATRHYIFNYAKIAEYYAHASKDMQALMEKSALVIIDFKKAIELGYVKLINKLADEYYTEYEREKEDDI